MSGVGILAYGSLMSDPGSEIGRRAWKNWQAVVIPGNGFDRVIVRKGRWIFVNEAALFAWLARESVRDEMPER